MQEITTAWKIAVSVVIMSFIISIVVSVMYITRAFWNRTEVHIEGAVVRTADAEAYQAASFGRPIPVPTIWKVVNGLTGSSANDTSNKLAKFEMYDGVDASGHPIRVTNKYSDITNYLNRKGWFSYEEGAGVYSVSITLTD